MLESFSWDRFNDNIDTHQVWMQFIAICPGKSNASHEDPTTTKSSYPNDHPDFLIRQKNRITQNHPYTVNEQMGRFSC